MFNYYNPCSMCMPVPIYLKGPYPMMPMGYGCDHVSETKENDDDLKCLYPRIYFKVYPLVKRHCDMMEREKDKDYCPCEKEIADACKEIYKRIKHELDDDDDDDYTRQRRYRRRHAINDLIRIILISELLVDEEEGEGEDILIIILIMVMTIIIMLLIMTTIIMISMMTMMTNIFTNYPFKKQ